MTSKSTTRKPKFKPLTTIEIEVAVAKYFGIRQHIIVPNLSWGFGVHECDLFVITKAGMGIEVEIKRSKSDFLADFKKGHNHVDPQNRIADFYYAMPKELYPKVEEFIPEGAGVILCERYLDYKKREVVYAYTERNPIRRKGVKRLPLEDQLRVARLGTMRIWSLKEKIIKLKTINEQN